MQYQLHAVRRALVPLPDALKPGFDCVRTHWIRGFMAFELARTHPDQGAQFLREQHDAVTIG
jgi:hypothetical protein